MAHHDRSIRERAIVLAEKGDLPASTAGELWSSHVHCKGMITEMPEGWASWKAYGNWVMACFQPSSGCYIWDLKAATGFSGQKDTIISRLRAAGLRARHVAMKELLTDEHKLYRLAFAEVNVDCKWDRVIFIDESTFTSANDGPVLVYRPQGQPYNPQFCLPANAVVVCL